MYSVGKKKNTFTINEKCLMWVSYNLQAGNQSTHSNSINNI